MRKVCCHLAPSESTDQELWVSRLGTWKPLFALPDVVVSDEGGLAMSVEVLNLAEVPVGGPP